MTPRTEADVDARLAEIRERNGASTISDVKNHLRVTCLDIAFLLGLVERLKTENERLRVDLRKASAKAADPW